MAELSVNKKDFLASTLVGLIWESPALDPLAVQHLDNQLSIIYIILHDLVSQVNLIDQFSLIVNHFATCKINGTLLVLEAFSCLVI